MMDNTQIEILCPVCAGCKHGEKTGIIYCYCRKHTEEAQAAKDAEGTVINARLKMPRPSPDVAKVTRLQEAWKSSQREKTNAERNRGYWKRRNETEDIGDKLSEAESDLAFANKVESRCRTEAAAAFEALKLTSWGECLVENSKSKPKGFAVEVEYE